MAGMPDEVPTEPIAIPISGELDLHTFRPAEVAPLLDDYFAECRKRGLRRVRVIHGKGTGALRVTVHALLRRSPLVEEFASGDEMSGGWGATLVTLTPRDNTRSNHSSGPYAAGHSAVVGPAWTAQRPRMGTKFIYAVALTLSQAVFSLLMFFLGFQTDKLATGQYFNWVPLVINVVVLWLGIRAVREENEGKYLTYGQGVGAGTLISLFSGLMSSVYTYIHFKIINPNFFDYQVVLMREKWAEKGLSEDKMEQAEAMMRKFSGPGFYAISTPIIVLCVGVIISLIVAAILKRNPPEEGKVAA